MFKEFLEPWPAEALQEYANPDGSKSIGVGYLPIVHRIMESGFTFSKKVEKRKYFKDHVEVFGSVTIGGITHSNVGSAKIEMGQPEMAIKNAETNLFLRCCRDFGLGYDSATVAAEKKPYKREQAGAAETVEDAMKHSELGDYKELFGEESINKAAEGAKHLFQDEAGQGDVPEQPLEDKKEHVPSVVSVGIVEKLHNTGRYTVEAVEASKGSFNPEMADALSKDLSKEEGLAFMDYAGVSVDAFKRKRDLKRFSSSRYLECYADHHGLTVSQAEELIEDWANAKEESPNEGEEKIHTVQGDSNLAPEEPQEEVVPESKDVSFDESASETVDRDPMEAVQIMKDFELLGCPGAIFDEKFGMTSKKYGSFGKFCSHAPDAEIDYIKAKLKAAK